MSYDDDLMRWASHLAAEVPERYDDPDYDRFRAAHLVSELTPRQAATWVREGWVPQPGEAPVTNTPETEAAWERWRAQQPQGRLDLIDRLKKHFGEWVQKEKPWSPGWKRPVDTYDDAIYDWQVVAEYIRKNFPDSPSSKSLTLDVPSHRKDWEAIMLHGDLDPIQEGMIALHNMNQNKGPGANEFMYRMIRQRNDRRDQAGYDHLVQKQRETYPQLFVGEPESPAAPPAPTVPSPVPLPHREYPRGVELRRRMQMPPQPPVQPQPVGPLQPYQTMPTRGI